MMRKRNNRRRATILLMVVGLLAMLFVIVTAYLTLARFEGLTTKSVENRRKIEEVVDGTNSLILSLIREQLTDERGDAMTGIDPDGASLETIPGFRAAHWLAGLEPVRDPNIPPDTTQLGPQYGEMTQYVWPAMSSLERTLVIQKPLRDLLLDYNEDGVVQISSNPANNDIWANARFPFMDADGDGVPDSYFPVTRQATELANMIAGRSVRVPTQMPTFGTGTQNNPDVLLWNRFKNNARYVTAVRVVAHGGKVALSSPGLGGSSVWNRQFEEAMFRWVKKRTDVNPLPINDDEFFNELYANAAAIEPILERRGGMSPSYAGTNGTARADGRVPAVLRRLERDFAGTFVPDFRAQQGAQPKKLENWQRFALAKGNPNSPDASEWVAWKNGYALDAEDVYQNTDATNPDPTFAYQRRQLLTLLSNSDELARPQNALRDPRTATQALGLRPGAAKYYLGDLTRQNGPFDQTTGQFNDAVGGAGPAEARRLANYYFEMLSGYVGWKGESPETEAVTLREQAMMLAVNTLAFAAPRDPTTGAIDVVYMDDVDPNGGERKRYIGYTPQPFITQVIAYNDGTGTSSTYKMALGIELYNPNDPSDASTDTYALPLGQFGISVNDRYETAGEIGILASPSTPGPQAINRLEGRRFMAFGLRGTGGGSVFDNLPQGSFTSLPVTPIPSATGDAVTVKLWKRSLTGNWFLVDQQEVDLSTRQGQGDEEWYVNTYRDTRAEPYFGNYGDPNRGGRWRMATAFPASSSHYQRDTNDGSPTTAIAELGVEGPSVTDPFGPTTPLYTMNAVATPFVLRGTSRPSSFPTPGFVMLVPRFSHFYKLDSAGTPIERNPMSTVLAEQWKKGESRLDPGAFAFTGPQGPNYPADFGHMPVFDNYQAVARAAAGGGKGSYFDAQRAGRLPWGLLVYDYFTTLNLNDPNGDGSNVDKLDVTRIPGRIDINTAPWFVLAGLPMLNPLTQLPASASPAFRNPEAGVLVGVDSLGDTRFDTTTASVINVSDPTLYRLGPNLAATAAAYRDRIAYLPTGAYPYSDAELRNETVGGPQYRDPTRYAKPGENPIRGGTQAAQKKYGFLSIGELLNAKAFDRSVLDANTNVNYMTHGNDYMKAVGLLALLDSQFLTTRSNTFTVYVTVTDREKPQSSVRSQLTVDRSNVLPRLTSVDPDGTGPLPAELVTIKSDAMPEIIGQRELGYFNAQFDE